ncbi:MAG: hypothetical protein U0V74_15230 [Chitinophagales bacterium]
MKALGILALFITLLHAPFSDGDGLDANKGTFVATVDGRPFKLRDDQLYRGLLMTKSPSMDGRTPARTVISTTFNGLSYTTSAGKEFNETLAVEIEYLGEKTGPYNSFAYALQFESTNYYMLPEGSKMNVTQFVWEADKKHFLISADFDCKMRSWGYPGDGKRDVALKGKLGNIRITVPSWLAGKN